MIMDESTSTPIDNLVDDCLLYIFKFCSIRDRVNLQVVCRRWSWLCLSFWKNYHTFDVCDEQLGYNVGRNLDVIICSQVFVSVCEYLTKINLSRTTNFQKVDDMANLIHCCNLSYDFPRGTLNRLMNYLSKCENIEELSLCRCVLDVRDEDLIEIFKKNRKLRRLNLSRYNLVGQCLSSLPLNVLESITLENCRVNKKYFDFVVYTAPNLHTLGIKGTQVDFNFSEFRILPTLSSKLMHVNFDNLEEEHPLFVHDIINLKNLTTLSLAYSELGDDLLKKIAQNCKKLIELNIGVNLISDRGISYLKFLTQLKKLNIGGNDDITDTGLEYLSENLQELNIFLGEFSRTAILRTLRKMQVLEKLDVSDCDHLRNDFVKSAVSIVRNRPNKIPLEIELVGTDINANGIKNDYSEIDLTWTFFPNRGIRKRVTLKITKF